MLRRVCSLLSVAALSAVAITTPAAARLQPPGGQPQLSGSARITGRIVASDNGRPVRRASVSLSGVPDSQLNAGPNRAYVSRRVETDVNGRFEFAGLPAGSYSVSVAPVGGFVPLQRAKEATLAEGRTVEMTVRLGRSGAIEGRIQDGNGNGMLGAEVQAVRRLTVGSHTTLDASGASGASATTNDLGEFRLFNLPPGEYYVVATFDRAPHYRGPVPRVGYANTYYPGSAALRGARALVVRAGRDRAGVNFALAPCRLARLSITPVDSGGVPLGRETHMSLTRRDDVYLRSSTRQTGRRDDGTFRFDGIQPGDYRLLVATSVLKEEAAYVNVSIGGEDVSLRVQTNGGANVSGRVVIDGRPAADGGSQPRKVWISAHPPPGTLGISYTSASRARMQGTDRFELAGLRGPMVLYAEVAGGALLSIHRRGEEIAGKTLEFVGTETLDDVVVELTTQVAQVDVTVTSARARGEPEPVMLILFSEDRKRWHQGSLQYGRTTASPVSDGAGATPSAVTRLTRMAPGRYLLAAIHDVDLTYPTEVGALETLRALVAGQTAKVTVPVAKRPE
jgi:uncharacterized protein (DUF2141 family)